MADDGIRLGMLGIHYPPSEPLGPVAQAEWEIQQAAALDLAALHLYNVPTDAPGEVIERLAGMARDAGVELECELPWEVFTLDRSLWDEIALHTAAVIATAARLGADIVRGGYGCITLDTTRYARHARLDEHLAAVAARVSEVAGVASDHGLLLAVENHCDFSGAEIVRILETVDRADVGAAVDTGNSFPVFTDWRADVEAMAPWAFATHLKDMRVVPSSGPGAAFTVEGCVLGDGELDVPWIVGELLGRSPRGEALRFIVEVGWPPDAPTQNGGEQLRAMTRASLRYLRECV
jgi:sugar phosphate isomerase/epimerase